MTIDRIKALVSKDLDAVNALILEKIGSESGLADTLGHHILNSGGKRLRPMLVLLASRACNYQGQLHIPLAALVECFHTATLLHDDVVDESTLRRGKQTANTIWGSKASILVGDFLFTQTVQFMVEVDHPPIQRLLARTAHDISRGELKQLANRCNMRLSLEDYLDVIRSKTALLFAASTAIGPLLQDPNHPLEQAFYQYGLHLGNAFQLIDDTLDYCSDADTMGKNSGDDLADGKITLPLLHLLKHGNEIQKKLVEQSLQTGSRSHFTEILSAIESTGSIEYTRAVAKHERDEALKALALVPDSPYKSALIDLAHFSLERSY